MKFKRLLALAVIAAMITGMTPSVVFAEETNTAPDETTVESSEPEEEETSKSAEESKVEPEETVPQKSKPEDKTPAEAGEDAKEEETEEKVPSRSERVKAKYDASGTEDNITWNLENGTLTVSGKGNMPDWNNSKRPGWYDSRDSITKVVVGKGLTTVGECAFENCESIKSVSLPSGITKIGKNAFYLCFKAETINIPCSVTDIGDSAFNACNSLKSIVLPSGLKTIGEAAFAACDTVTGLTIPGSVKDIKAYAFNECMGLKTLKIFSGVQTIGQNAFSGCEELVSVTIPGTVKTIDYLAFGDCYKLKNVSIGYGVETIGNYVFSDTGLETLTIPDSVTSLGKEILASCTSLRQINVTEELHLNFPSAWGSVSDTVIFNHLKPNPMTVKGKTAKVKYRKLRKKTRTVSASKVLKFSSGTGPYLYVKVSGKKKITINKTTGKVTVKKKLRRGTYKIKVKVMSVGNANYKSTGWKTVTFKINVR